MNHAEVSIAGMCQRVKYEIDNVLDYTDIGKDNVFEVRGTDIMPISSFKSKPFYRVPCTTCEVYLREIIASGGYQIYELAYQTTTFYTGAILRPFYRIISLESKPTALPDCGDNSEPCGHGVLLPQAGVYTIPTSTGRPIRFATDSTVDVTRTNDVIINYNNGYSMY